MTVIWGIHNDQPSLDLVEGGFISIGWDPFGDVSQYGPDREAIKAALIAAFPEAKPGAIPVWAGVLDRFAFEMQPCDLIISPNKLDSTVNIGEVTGPFYRDESAEVHRNRRPVKWLHTGVPRVTFSKTARNEIGSAVTLFRVKRHAAEFLAFIETGQVPDDQTLSTDDEAIESAEDEPNAERIETYSRDFVIETLQRMDPFRFEQFVAALLRALGYEAHATQAVGDGGVDVIAHRDPLGLEPPIIKVQCKRTASTIGGPAVQNLAGTLAHGGSEVGLFVSLGTYSSDATHIERTRQDIRLINGKELVDLVFAHYEGLDSEWRRLLPLRKVYVVDRDPEAS